MKVFISWSGELSKQLAQALRQWLPGTLQSVKPYFTPADVEKGAKWDNEISKELEETDYCVIAMTREALKSHWIVFEAGALSKETKKSRVCAICFNIEPTDIQGPLTRFQAIKWNKSEFRQLVNGINKAGGEAALSDSVLEEVFEERWLKLESQIEKTLKGGVATKQSSEVRSEKELLEEVLLLVRGMQDAKLKLDPAAYVAIQSAVNTALLRMFPATLPLTPRQRVVNALAGEGPLDVSLLTSSDVKPESILGALEQLFREKYPPETRQASKPPTDKSKK